MLVQLYALLLHLQRYELLKPRKHPSEMKYVDYSVEVSMKQFFQVPKKFSIPVLTSARVNLDTSSAKHPTFQKIGNTLKGDCILLPR